MITYRLLLGERQKKDKEDGAEVNLDECLVRHLKNVKDIVRVRKGYCPCCENNTLFIAQDYWLRDHYKCILCYSIPRQRAIMRILKERCPNWREAYIHESSPSGPTFKAFCEKCDNYTYSYWDERKTLGYQVDNVETNQNLEKLSFADEIFDVFITQDVFEHISNPQKAFSEINRVLKNGGIHIFTVPIYPFQKTRTRIRIEQEKEEVKIINVLPPIYHSNPLGGGSLVTWDWGNDIVELIKDWTGMESEIIEFPNCRENVHNGLEADFLQVIVSQKKKE